MTPQPAEQPRTALREFVEEASFGPWRRETGVAPSEEEHMVWLTNEAGDSLLVNADDVAMLVNAAIEAAAPDPVATALERVPFVRYQLTKGSTTLTFRVPPGTPMILEQSGWRITSEDGELPVATPAPLDAVKLADALEAEGFVRGVAARYGTFNRPYWEQSAAAILKRLEGATDGND